MKWVYVVVVDDFALDAFKTLEQAEKEFAQQRYTLGTGNAYINAVPYYKKGLSRRRLNALLGS